MPISKPALAPLLCAGLLLSVTTASATLSVTFTEGAPKDRFRIENTGTCAITTSTLRLDLSASQGGLIFDVTGAGQGVEVYQPFELVEGEEALRSLPTVRDGQKAIDLEIATLAPGQAIAFTIDVDDTIGQREITVTGAEIAGAQVVHFLEPGEHAARFTSDATAKLPTQPC